MEAPGIEFEKQLRHYPRGFAVLAPKFAELFGFGESGKGGWGPWGSVLCGGGGAVWGRCSSVKVALTGEQPAHEAGLALECLLQALRISVEP